MFSAHHPRLSRPRLSWVIVALLASFFMLAWARVSLAEIIGEETHRDDLVAFKPGKGFALTTRDRNFALITRLRAQFRYAIDDQRGDGKRAEQSLQLRRARLQFLGHLYGQGNTFKVEIAISPRDMGLATLGHDQEALTKTPLLSWYMHFKQLRDLNLRIGQYKIPYSRQRVVSSGNLQLVDRSIVNGEFNLDRDIGLDLRSKDFLGLELLRYYLFIGIGEGRDGFRADDFGMLYIARFEVLPFGLFDDYSESDLLRSNTWRLSLGAAYAYLANAKRDRGILGSRLDEENTRDTHNITIDGLLKWHGFSLFSAFMWRKGSRDGYGFEVQAGSFIGTLPLELSGRFSFIRRSGSSKPSLVDKNEAGAALGYFFAGHPFKVQLDIFRIWESKAGVGAGQDEFRLQLQASF